MDIVIRTPLNVIGFNKQLELDPKWVDSRLAIMKKYLFPAMSAQTDNNYYWFVETREETRDQVKKSLRDCPEGEALPIVVTTPKEKEAAVMIIVTSGKFLEVRLNSDDCYHKDFVKRLRKVKLDTDTQAVIANNGYMWYMKEGVIVEREFASPPFYAFVYNKSKFTKGFRYRPENGHCGVFKMPHKVMTERNWLWLVHGRNYKQIRGAEYPKYTSFKQVSKKVLKDFGL